MMVSRTTGLMLVCLALLCTTAVANASATLVYTTANSDGSVSTSEGYSDGYTWSSNHGDRISTEAGASFSNNEYVDDWGSYHRFSNFSYAVLQFPLASLRGKTLAPNSAKLHFYGHSYNVLSSTVALYGANLDAGGALCQGMEGWGIYGFTDYDDPGTIAYSQVSSACSQPTSHHVADVPITRTAAWCDVDVTADLQRQINAGYDWAGYFFSMRHVPGQGFAAATYEDAAHQPFLEVVPEPSSLLALMAGISGLGGVLIRRRR